MGLGDFFSGLPIVGDIFAGLTGTAQADAQSAAAGYQYQASAAQIKSNERISNQALELDRDKFEFLKEQAAVVAPTSQSGSIGYPYVAVKQYKAAPLVSMPVIIAGGLLFFFFKRKR